MPRVSNTLGFRTDAWRLLYQSLVERCLCFTLLLILAVLFATSDSIAQQSRLREYQIKATYLYNFGRFVKWPESPATGRNDPFGVCVLGQDPFGSALDSTFAGETLEGKPVAIRRLAKPQDAAGCHILFISSTEESHLKAILAALNDVGTLTVSDMPGFTEQGGMIQFVFDGNKIRFEVNLASAESSRLILSSELLKVASTVRGNTPPGE